MVIPAIISFIISSSIINIVPIDGIGNENIKNIISSPEKKVLGVTDVIVSRAQDFFYFRENNLPQNEDKMFFPKKISKDEFYSDVRSGVVLDKKTGISLWRKDMDEKSAIASITKLMSALVFLDNNPGWDTVYKIKKEDRREGGKIYLYFGDEVRVRDLFLLSLIGSANTATIALANSTGMEEAVFVEKMNEKAKTLGLSETIFKDPTGLSKWNISTARQVAKLALEAFSNKDIKEAAAMNKYTFKTLGGREIKVDSTDWLLKNFPKNGINITSGKTGYTDDAGSCFVGEFVNNDGKEVVSVILGAKNNEERFFQTKDLIGWIYANYEWPY